MIIQETFNREKDFPRLSLFANLSNLSVGFETFLRSIISQRISIDNKNLKSLIAEMFSGEKIWWSQFETKYAELVKNYRHDVTVEHLYDSVTDPNLHKITKVVLTTYLTRNFVMHTFASSDEFYQDVFSEIYRSIFYSTFYVWSFSLKYGWI